MSWKSATAAAEARSVTTPGARRQLARSARMPDVDWLIGGAGTDWQRDRNARSWNLPAPLTVLSSQPLRPLTMTHSGDAMDIKHSMDGNSPGNLGPIPFSMSSPDQVLEGTIAIRPYLGNPDVVA